MVREGLGFSIVHRLAFLTALSGVTLVSLRPRVYRQLGLAIRDQEYTPPALHAFLQTVGDVAQKKRKG
jgi:DNA-binding transcriptional LysR family regulator